MKDIYKSIKLYLSYLKYLTTNPKSNFNDYLNYLMNNKKATIYDDDINEKTKFRIHNIKFNPNCKIIRQPSFILIKPEGMKESDVYKVISFAYNNFIFNKKNRLINNLEIILTRWLNFTYDNSMSEENITELFITNDFLNFIQTKYFDEYFTWLEPNISLEEIISIYQSIDPLVVERITRNYTYKPLK